MHLLYRSNNFLKAPWKSSCVSVSIVMSWPFDPTKNAIPRWCTGRRWHILMAVMRGNRVGGNWLMKWDELKNSHGTLIDWCTGREWPVNCMTVISALMTIKHSITKIEWAIVWALNYYITQSRRKSRGSWVRRAVAVELKIGRSYRRDVVGKATSGRRGLWALMNWGPEKMLIRCRKESHHPAVWGQNITVSVRSPAPSHSKTPHNLSEPLQ